jgi:hypothetical protein
MRKFTILVSVVFALATVLVIAEPAQASEHGCATDVISRFKNGDVAKAKTCVEYNGSNLRHHTKVSCWSSSNVAVDCAAINGDTVVTYVRRWSGGQVSIEQAYSIFSDVTWVHSKDFWSPWFCPGGSGTFDAKAVDLRVMARSGELGDYHDHTSNTTSLSAC